MKGAWRNRILLAAPGLALAGVVVTVALESHAGDRLINAVLGGLGLVLTWSVAVAVQIRYPQRALGPLLFVLAGMYGIASLITSVNPYLFLAARMARPVVELLLIWIMLAFPSGKLSGTLERGLLTTIALAILLLWLPSVLWSQAPPILGPYIACQADCPRNLLLISDRPELSHALSLAFRITGVSILTVTGASLFLRLRSATPLMRRLLAPVLLASIFHTLVLAAFLAFDTNRIAFTLSFWAMPLAIAIGLLRGRLYTARVLHLLVTGLRSRPDVHSLRSVMATALGDDTLEIAYWLKDSGHWGNDLGQAISLNYPASTEDRAVTIIRDASGGPVAALVHDPAILEEPTLVESVAGSMQVALESHRLEAQSRASETRTVSAVEAERRRIERDLHDGAQQRLIAMRIKLSVTERLLDQDLSRAATLIKYLGRDVDAAIQELRHYAHSIVPPLLAERGLAQALVEVAGRAAMPISLDIDEVGRLDSALEAAVFFCCLEALQNSAKHAGPTASVLLRLKRTGALLNFECLDTGAPLACQTSTSFQGQGIDNMTERMRGVGGSITVGLRGDGHFAVAGSVPVAVS